MADPSGLLHRSRPFLRTSLIAEHFHVQSGREIEAVGTGEFPEPFGLVPELIASASLGHEPDVGVADVTDFAEGRQDLVDVTWLIDHKLQDTGGPLQQAADDIGSKPGSLMT